MSFVIEVSHVELLLLFAAMLGGGAGLFWWGRSTSMEPATVEVLSPLEVGAVQVPNRWLMIQRRKDEMRIAALETRVEKLKQVAVAKDKLRARYLRLLREERRRARARVEHVLLAVVDTQTEVLETIKFPGMRRTEYWRGFDKGVETGAIAVIEGVREEALALSA